MEIIKNFSIENLTNFFREKIYTFKPTNVFDTFEVSDTDTFTDILKIGEATINDNNEIIVISAKSTNQLTSRSGKKKQFDIAKKILKQEYKDAAFFVFYDESGNFRFSFVRTNYIGKKREFTDYKRYTYFVSPQQTNRTFISQIEKADFHNLDSIIEAFSVEPLNREFYKQISNHFYKLTGGKIANGNQSTVYEAQMQLPSIDIETDRKTYQEFAVRLIGRIIFLWFLKNKKSDKGIPLIPENWLTPERVKQNPNYYHSLLEKLFFEILNKPVGKRIADLPEEHIIIPFLNGGLFEPIDDFYNPNKPTIRVNDALKIPDQWFIDFFETLQQFNFTIDENSIYDTEVSIDPEMLGTIFENLLAEIDPETGKTARNFTGSFYTPRQIVDYMVEESLVQYLKIQTNEDEEILHLLFKENELKSDFFVKKNEIIDAFDKIKILDPACGSGAFPMGALHKINIALQKLDPDAVIWKKKQLDKIDNKLYRDALKDRLEKSNVEYIRKFGVIQNSIYGVDIQPIATEISKLRCFLSLVVDENIKDEKKTRDIFQLPNLEFKFITADTLIKLEEPTVTIDFAQTYSDIEKMQKIRNDYLQTYGVEKQKLKSQFIELQKQIYFKEFKRIDAGKNKRSEQIINWKPFSHEKAEWFNPKWMFGVDKFDIVIGNPPYIQLQKTFKDKQKYGDLYKSQNYQTFKRTGDIYALFYERGTQLLKKNGILCYITSNKWMRANYGEALRKFFITKNPVKLIDMGPGVFNSATVDTNILILQNAKNKNNLQALTFSKQHNIEELNDNDFINLKNLSKESWIIVNQAEQKIKEKIEKIGTPLKNWKDIKIYRGILTGYNKAFIIDGKTKDKLIEQDPKSAEIIKPILRGRDIKRYKAEFADLWLIFIPWHFPLHNDSSISGNSKKAEEAFKKEYPAIYEHLLQYKDKLSKRNKAETGIRYEWYALQRCAASYYQEFEKEKIVYGQFRKGSFALDDMKMFLSSNEYMIVSDTLKTNNLKYLLALLNSKGAYKYQSLITNNLSGNTTISQKGLFTKLPIPQIPKYQQKPFEEKVDEIIRLKELGQDTSRIEAEIDKMVYELYGLTDEEIQIVEEKMK